MQHNVTGLLREGNKVTGVRYTSPEAHGELRADLVVGCDGRFRGPPRYRTPHRSRLTRCIRLYGFGCRAMRRRSIH